MRSRMLKIGLVILLATAGGYAGFELIRPGSQVILGEREEGTAAAEISIENRVRLAGERSENVKGVYMTGIVANDPGRAASGLRAKIVSLIDTTELNGVVIDVKETSGSEITPNLKPFIDDLKRKNVWTIARIAVFRDNSQVLVHPEWYLSWPDGRAWRDNKGNAWMDPMHPEVRAYLIDFSKTVVDLGFDELQYDYIRFPSDGDIGKIVYPAYDAVMPKHEALKDFFSFLNRAVKSYRPELILSADLFGLVAIAKEDLGIGQRLTDIGTHFDYISLMLYPSHFYSGFYVPADPARGLPALSVPYRSKTEPVVSAKPFEIVHRSLLRADDVLSGREFASSTASTTSAAFESYAKLRPWLQDFNLGADTSRGIYYTAEMVRAQIDAAEAAGASGWLLWSPTNTYTEAALETE